MYQKEQILKENFKNYLENKKEFFEIKLDDLFIGA